MNANHEKAIRLGITGGVGCGKTTAARVLGELGATVIDADEISHRLTEPGGSALAMIAETFGEGVFGEDGALDRRRLGEIVFSDEGARRALENILHPAIQRQMLDQIDRADEAGAPVVALDVPLLYECGLDAICDEVWVITAPREQQIIRVMARDRITRAQAEARIDSQMPLDEKAARARRVISTDRSTGAVRGELEHLYKELTRRK